MANAVTGNKIYVDTTGSVTTSRKLVKGILFTPAAINDQMVLREESTGPDALRLRGATANQTSFYDFSQCPLIFTNGIFIQTLTTGAVATIITGE